MGYWENTTYVEHDSVDDVADALAALLRDEGMTEFSPAPRQRMAVEPMQYDNALRNDRWGIALFPGAPNWTVIKTAPLELLGERREGGARMRLADLCAVLGVPAFQAHVYDDTGIVVVEASKRGEVLVSGFDPQGDDPFQWNGEHLDENQLRARFRLQSLQHLQPLLDAAPYGEPFIREIGKKYAGEQVRYCDNLVSVDTLIAHKPFDAPGGRVLYWQWPGPSRQRFNGCATWDEFRAQIKASQ